MNSLRSGILVELNCLTSSTWIIGTLILNVWNIKRGRDLDLINS